MEVVRRRAAHKYWFQLTSVLLYVDDDAGAPHTLVLIYRSYFLKPTSVLCSRSCGTHHTDASPRRKPAHAKFENPPAKDD